MPRKKTEQDVEILEKLEYIGLNLNKIPESLKKFEPLQFVFPKINNEKQQYKQYRFIPIKDIQILLSPTNRLDDLKEKYSVQLSYFKKYFYKTASLKEETERIIYSAVSQLDNLLRIPGVKNILCNRYENINFDNMLSCQLWHCSFR